MKVSSALINTQPDQNIYGTYSMPVSYNTVSGFCRGEACYTKTVAPKSVYRDNESDNYGRAAVNRLRGLGAIGIPGGLPAIGGGGVPGGSGAPAASATCAACPPNCTTTSQQTTYYARKQKLSDTDIPVKVNLKRIKCEGNQGLPKPACEQNLLALKRSMGMNGLNGCSACSGGYSNRM